MSHKVDLVVEVYSLARGAEHHIDIGPEYEHLEVSASGLFKTQLNDIDRGMRVHNGFGNHSVVTTWLPRSERGMKLIVLNRDVQAQAIYIRARVRA